MPGPLPKLEVCIRYRLFLKSTQLFIQIIQNTLQASIAYAIQRYVDEPSFSQKIEGRCGIWMGVCVWVLTPFDYLSPVKPSFYVQWMEQVL